MIKLVVQKNDSNQTLINFLKKTFKHESLAKIYHLFYKKKIKVNNKRVTNFKYLVQTDDVILIYDHQLTLVDKETLVDPQMKPEIAYQDQQILVVVKDHGIVTHSPTSQSLDNIVRYYLLQKEPKLFDNQTFTISHQYRLDKLTKGLVIYPKTKIAQQILVKAQAENNIIKKYLVVCQGKLTKEMHVSGFIFKDEINQKMVFTKKQVRNSKNCQTIIKPLKVIGDFSLLECQLVTGRKHQIRATLAYLNLPIIGDEKYGSEYFLKNQILLFAYYLGFQNLAAPLEYLNKQKITLFACKAELEKMMRTGFDKKVIKYLY
ncbi:RluA family pseudouridine synthase [Spiroplasma platyhelix]|uniref:RNA pseudouridylate synthase n=1 Tax=Spiroplasma platyhelix PALS-1 TaxID=1276218 RepID=A0A846TVJ5_9MOLU|nr:RluA family pseudouridine synthase [Spiroplasma platyhelix]MBE4703799.1 Ribosomal large subunit pseudouridine synthase D [Spiroplasma platyhelix PALS-1]NKE38172.1 RluA family pseudouridine synthase [Spiroplasma platyhelix PALS-1]UJB29057.1 ribosomal large subunit pseudouridine synthase C [Spiroplasma platyhelix PALS-1]